MKELNEKELKRLLEEQLEQDGKQLSPGNDDDAALYRLLFTALADEPNTSVNINLAESVIKQIKINELKKESIRYNMLIAFVLIAGVLSAYFAISYISPAALNSALNFIETYRWIAIFIILCFGIIQIADKNLVKRNLLSN
jgi:hypothetical protein